MSDFPGVSGIYGPLEIGVTLCTLLYGIQTFQTFHYYRNSSGDPIHLKLMVALIWFLELGQTICNLYTNYSWSITFYGRAPQEMLIHPSRFLLLGFLFSSLSRTVIELFFANRIQVLSKNRYIVLLCLVLTISCLVGSVILVAKIWTSPLGLIFLKSKLEWGMVVFTSVDPLADVLITLYMCLHLWRLRRAGTQFRRTQKILDTLVLWTIETTFLTSSVALIQVVLILTNTDLWFLAFRFIHSKLYSNCMLAVLNGRGQLRSDDEEPTIRISDLAFDLPGTSDSKPTSNYAATVSVAVSRISDVV